MKPGIWFVSLLLIVFIAVVISALASADPDIRAVGWGLILSFCAILALISVMIGAGVK